MSWDWDAEDIDPDEDDGKMWVPVTPQTMVVTETDGEISPPASKVREASRDEARATDRMMKVYAVRHGPDGVAQARTPIAQVVQMPRRVAKVVIRGNEEASETSELSEGTDEDMEVAGKRGEKGRKEKIQAEAGPLKSPGKVHVPKSTPVVTSTTPREVPCDQCRRMNRACLARTKGGQPLSACEGCHRVKMSCKTSGNVRTGRSEGGEPKGMEVDEGGPARPRRQQRPAAIQARAKLERSCTFTAPRRSKG